MPSFATDDGVNLHYETWGSGELTLVFEPPWLATVELFRTSLPLAELGLRVLAYDKRGMGRSDRPDPQLADYSVERLARDSISLTDELDLERVVAIGFFDGCRRAVRRALERPDQTVGLVLSGPLLASWAELGVPDSMQAAGEALLRIGFNNGVQMYVSTGMPDATEEQRRATVEALRDCSTADIALAHWGAGAAVDDRPLLPRVGCPSVVLAGTEDVAAPLESVHEVARALPDARLVELAGAGNALWVTKTAEAVEATLELLRSLEPSPAERG